MPEGDADDEEIEIDLKTSGFTGSWSLEGGVVPVWIHREEPPAQVESDTHNPLSSALERLGLRIEPDRDEEPLPDQTNP